MGEKTLPFEKVRVFSPTPPLSEGKLLFAMKFPGEFERAAALSFLIIFGDMCGENAGFLKEQALALAVKNPFPVPPSEILQDFRRRVSFRQKTIVF